MLKSCTEPFFGLLSSIVLRFEVSMRLASYLAKLCWDTLRLTDLVHLQTQSLKLASVLYSQYDINDGVDAFASKVWNICCISRKRTSSLRGAVLESMNVVVTHRAHRFSNQSLQTLNPYLITCIEVALSREPPDAFVLTVVSSIRTFLLAFPQFDERSTMYMKSILLLDKYALSENRALKQAVIRLKEDFM